MEVFILHWDMEGYNTFESDLMLFKNIEDADLEMERIKKKMGSVVSEYTFHIYRKEVK